MHPKKTIGDSGTCNQAHGYCVYSWDTDDQKFYKLANKGGCADGFVCPAPKADTYGGSEELDLYEEFLVVVCCEAANSGN